MQPLVDFLIIGAMKCGTTSLHDYLGQHPEIGMAREKEVNFFFGTASGGPGNAWRGVDWYRSRFPADATVRGEASPGYTSPDHPGVAARIAELAPGAKLLYLVRDPFERAVSQYRHHRRDGDEVRDLAAAILDPSSHYLRRSRYAERLRPFLQHADPSRIAVIEHRDLARHTEATVGSVCDFLGVDPLPAGRLAVRRLNRSSGAPPAVPVRIREAFRAAVADDAAELDALRERIVALGPDQRGVAASR